jgi:hypothetical protein
MFMSPPLKILPSPGKKWTPLDVHLSWVVFSQLDFKNSNVFDMDVSTSLQSLEKCQPKLKSFSKTEKGHALPLNDECENLCQKNWS